MKTSAILLLTIGLLLGCHGKAVAEELANKEFDLKLPAADAPSPCLKEAAWADGERAFRGAADAVAWRAWLAGTLPEGEMRPEGSWTIEAGPIFQNARRSMRCGDLQVTCHVELAGGGTTFRTYTELKNLGSQPVRVDRFPVWKDRWLLPPGEVTLRWWDSLTFEPRETSLSPGKHVALHSETYSSQQDKSGGNLPFWHLWAGGRHLFFSLVWCGGWRADVVQTAEGTSLEVVLPPEETGLVLGPGEAITGPVVCVTAIRSPDAGDARAQWLRQREALDERLYGGPKPRYPLIYNHWYAARADFDLPFLQRQLEELPSWGFDLFVLDHGWFEKVGDWRPARAKFRPGELEGFYDELRKKGLKTGIWSCPWLQAVDRDHFPPEIDEPHFYQRFMHAYSLDMAGIDFTRRLVDHIALLESQFHVDWWKYDQELFGPESRHGRMKNVVALQDALLAVRRAYPKLNIENCMSGGRMINALTDGIAQSHWIRDGGHTGLAHARSNVKEALGAAYFLPLAKIQRWMNRPDEINPADEDLLRMYCRSAMIGAWGISGDLTKIAPDARRVILAEVEHYRRLSEFKASHRYEILYPRDESKLAGIVLYDLPARRAAVLLFRWQEDGPLIETIPLGALPKEGNYTVTDADTGATRRCPGIELVQAGLSVSFGPARRSGLYWVEPAT